MGLTRLYSAADDPGANPEVHPSDQPWYVKSGKVTRAIVPKYVGDFYPTVRTLDQLTREDIERHNTERGTHFYPFQMTTANGQPTYVAVLYFTV